MDKVNLTDEELREKLSPEAFHVCREHGTERPFTGKFYDCKDEGVYKCICCDNELFSSKTKFDSGSGWPSYFDPINEKSLELKADSSLGMHRVEVLCAKCGSHLGHVFDDGPKPSGKRYCINSVSLDLKKHD